MSIDGVAMSFASALVLLWAGAVPEPWSPYELFFTLPPNCFWKPCCTKRLITFWISEPDSSASNKSDSLKTEEKHILAKKLLEEEKIVQAWEILI